MEVEGVRDVPMMHRIAVKCGPGMMDYAGMVHRR
jgi:hypothetical protein